MDCEMCGREQAAVRAAVEGTTLSLCAGCARYGKVVGKVVTAAAAAAARKKDREEKAVLPEEETEFVVANLGQLVKQKREQLGLKQEEFARRIAVKESVLHKIETGHFKPSLDEAGRVGKILGLKLVEKVEALEEAVPQPKKDQLTLGDMIKVKRK